MSPIEQVGGWPTILGRLCDGHDLTAAEAGTALSSILAGEATDAQIAAFIVALRLKGESVDEVAGMIDAMREASTSLTLPEATIDIVGTGGSPRRRIRSLNVSTMASFVAAAAGAAVCKHGNRKASSTSGSFDLLEALGITIELSAAGVERCVDEVGLGFCFAKGFHPAMRHAGPVRAQLGVPTVFNLLGPLSHPGRVTRQVLGVGDPRLLDLVAGACAKAGAVHTIVVHGCDSLDELTIVGPSDYREVRDGEVVGSGRIDPVDHGLTVVAEAQIPGGTPADNARLAHELFDGVRGPVRDIVVLNAGAGLWVGGRADSLTEGVEQAGEAIDGGAAAAILEQLVKVSSSADG